MRSRLARSHVRAGVRLLLAAVLLLGLAAPVLAADPPSPGPPYPAPEPDRAVYDYAGVFKQGTILSVESTIDGIEARTGVETVVYTQVAGYGVTTSKARSDAAALMDQWGVGQRGIDNGVVIMFDLDPTRLHGQVFLYGGAGFLAAYMDQDALQAIFDDEMLPHLRAGDLDSAVLAAIATLDGSATPEAAARLQTARQVNAVVGIIGGGGLLLAMVFWGARSWLRTGKDPVYTDDDSVLMAGPPPNLSAASAAALMDGGANRRALTTAMLDLASRGKLSFREEKKLLGLGGTKVGIDTNPGKGDDVTEAHRALNDRRPLGEPEQYALQKLRSLASSDYLEPDDVPKFGTHVSGFDSRLENSLARSRWMIEAPGKVTGRWVGQGILAIFGGILVIVAGANLNVSGLVLLGGCAIAGGIFFMVVAKVMPSVTRDGAIVVAQLKAYRRTLQRTMEQARSMQQVVDGAGLSWLETPDQAVVWGTALGLQSEIEGVLARSLEDVRAGRTTYAGTYFPVWYTNQSGRSFATAGAGGGGGGLFSSSPIPNIGGMMAALGTIGNSPSSSGSGSGGGGFSGGGSGGGGGGGGGF
jgi:uncharacterized membrane protein YgcG